MIEEYWNEMFGRFKVSEKKFLIPGFPEPLMSAHFGQHNIVGPCARETRMSFQLCLFTPSQGGPVDAHVETVEEAFASPHFHEFQRRENPEAYPFIQRLLPFLINHGLPHKHLFIKCNDEIVASMLVGIGEKTFFIFNACVQVDRRGEGLMKNLHRSARNLFPGKQGFYWTKHPWFTLGAEAVQEYHLV